MPVDWPAVEWEVVAWNAALVFVAAVATYAVFAWLLAPALARAVAARNPRNRTLVNAVRLYVQAAGTVAAVVVGALVAGYGGVLTGSAIVVAAATLAIGVAGQEVFGNVVSGVFLVSDGNFNVGDWVSWGGDVGGVVEAVGFRTTRVRTATNEIVTVPNAELATRAVRNPYARGRFRTSVAVDVPFNADLDAATDALIDAAASVERVAESPPPEALASFGDGTITLELRVWIREPAHADVRRVQSRLTAAVQDALDAAGVDVTPVPMRELSGRVVVDSSES